MDEQIEPTIYEPPALVELGEFNEDTLGFYGRTLETYQSVRDE